VFEARAGVVAAFHGVGDGAVRGVFRADDDQVAHLFGVAVV
jgi:hypothetical protein